MEEKNQQEKMAIVRQVELFENAFNKAKENGGMWLDNDGRKAPKLYLKPLQISAFNAIILGMHSDPAQTIKHCQLTSRRIIKESGTVKSAHFSISSRPHSLWLIKQHLIR